MGKKKNGHTNGTNSSHDTASPNIDGATAIRRFTQDLPCKLEDEATAELREKLVNVVSERVKQEEQIAILRECVKGLSKREAELVGKLHKNTEERQVECVEYLLPTNEVLIVRVDTSEVVSRRTAEAEDLQEPMFSPPAPAAEAAPQPTAGSRAALGAAAARPGK
jgi:hypothetical protein